MWRPCSTGDIEASSASAAVRYSNPLETTLPGAASCCNGQRHPTANPAGVQLGNGVHQSHPATNNGGTPSSAALSSSGGIIAVTTLSTALVLCLIAGAASFVIVWRKRQNRANEGMTTPSAEAPGRQALRSGIPSRHCLSNRALLLMLCLINTKRMPFKRCLRTHNTCWQGRPDCLR